MPTQHQFAHQQPMPQQLLQQQVMPQQHFQQPMPQQSLVPQPPMYQSFVQVPAPMAYTVPINMQNAVIGYPGFAHQVPQQPVQIVRAQSMSVSLHLTTFGLGQRRLFHME